MGAQFEVRNGVGVVTLRGPLTAVQAEGFRNELTGWYANGATCRNVVLDCQHLEFMDSSGLGALIAILKRISEHGGDLLIAGLSKKVRMVFEITRAHRIFRILDTVEEAIAGGR